MKSCLIRLLSICLLASFCGGMPACAPPSALSLQEDTAQAETVVFCDALGREVSLPKHPDRVAALLGSFADVWVLAGGELCAAAEDAREDFGLELPGAVSIGGAHSPDLERLISADPELVLASASTASHVEMREILEALGITVVYFNVDTFADYLAMLDVCTDVTGRKDLYDRNGLQIEAQIEAVKASYASAPIPDGERTVLLLRASSGFVKAKGSRGTILGEMLADLGCINVADSDGSLLENLSVEAVIRAEPRHIFVTTMGSDTAAAMASLTALLEGNPAWGTLEAVACGRVHIMDKTLFNLKPNDRWGEAYRKLYEALTEE
jgi:iron complex transport system substrate-binding protein